MTHPEETVQLGLRVLALCNGNCGQAARILANDSDLAHPPAKETLRDWKQKTYAHRYLETLHEMQGEIAGNTADKAMEIAGTAADAEELLIAETVLKVKDIEPKDLARSALAMTQVKAENVRTSRLLREQPTAITEHRDPAELLKELQHLNVFKQPKDEAIDVEPVAIDAETDD